MTTEVEAYIRQQAILRGMDPDRVVAAVNTEGGVRDPFRQAGYVKNGYREPSYGPMQLLVGGDGTGFPEGLGNKMIRETGVDPRQDWQAGIRYGLDTVKNEGWRQWYGPKNAGYDRWYGVNKDVPSQAVASYQPTQNTQQVAQQTAVNPAVTQGIASLPTVAEVTPQAVPQPMPTTTNPTATTPASPFSGIFNAMMQSNMQAQQAHQQAVAAEEPMMRGSDQRPVGERVAATSQTPNAYYDELMKRFG
jgi:hypothetical protein